MSVGTARLIYTFLQCLLSKAMASQLGNTITSHLSDSFIPMARQDRRAGEGGVIVLLQGPKLLQFFQLGICYNPLQDKVKSHIGCCLLTE